jgi:hypothetical protein
MMVVMDKLMKVSHFIIVKMTHKETKIAKFYTKKIARLHGAHKEIMFDRDSKFISNFWKGLFKGFGTNTNFIRESHPELHR